MEFGLLIAVLLLLILLNIPIALALAGAGIFGLILAESPMPLLAASFSMWASTNSFSLAAVPLFIFLAHVLQNTKAFDMTIKSLDPWASLLPGRLLHTNIIGSTLFAAITGSSSSSCVAIATLTYKKLQDRGYNKALTIATLAGPTTLGILIPPSIILILYGVISEESISKLFVAGIIPGILLCGLFTVYVVVASMFFVKQVSNVTETYKWSDRIRSLPSLLPIISLISFILGGIYLGWVIPTEAAAWGTMGALLIALFGGDLTLDMLSKSIRDTVTTSVMVLFIVMGASLLSMAFAQSGIASDIVRICVSLELSKYMFLGLLVILYGCLGCLMEGLSMIVLTVPLLLPVVKAYGFDIIWFGIFVTILIEIGQFTPPVGLNLFILRGVTNESILFVAKSSLPMIVLMLIGLLLVVLFPEMILYLPGTMK